MMEVQFPEKNSRLRSPVPNPTDEISWQNSMTDNPHTLNLPSDSEAFRSVPHDAEEFGTIPNHAESFRTLRNAVERQQNHTLTVREVARLFETAGVARTERSIINWCQPNRTGAVRLDCYFDPNDRKYFITPQSVELAIAEEKAKAAKLRPEISESAGNIPNTPESRPSATPPTNNSEDESGRVKTLEQEVMDLKIVNRGKDYYIEQLREEREGLLGQLISSSHKVGELETRLLQLRDPNHDTAPELATVSSELSEIQRGAGHLNNY